LSRTAKLAPAGTLDAEDCRDKVLVVAADGTRMPMFMHIAGQ
jgi:hypothetical protein